MVGNGKQLTALVQKESYVYSFKMCLEDTEHNEQTAEKRSGLEQLVVFLCFDLFFFLS